MGLCPRVIDWDDSPRVIDWDYSPRVIDWDYALGLSIGTIALGLSNGAIALGLLIGNIRLRISGSCFCCVQQQSVVPFLTRLYVSRITGKNRRRKKITLNQIQTHNRFKKKQQHRFF